MPGALGPVPTGALGGHTAGSCRAHPWRVLLFFFLQACHQGQEAHDTSASVQHATHAAGGANAHGMQRSAEGGGGRDTTMCPHPPAGTGPTCTQPAGVQPMQGRAQTCTTAPMRRADNAQQQGCAARSAPSRVGLPAAPCRPTPPVTPTSPTLAARGGQHASPLAAWCGAIFLARLPLCYRLQRKDTRRLPNNGRGQSPHSGRCAAMRACGGAAACAAPPRSPLPPVHTKLPSG
jgi:hypothetical protein